MLNYIWTFMIMISIIYGTLTGNIADVGNEAVTSAKEAVELCITMVGVMSMWLGVMEVADKSGIIRRLENMLSPVINYLFPEVEEDSPARPYIAANIISNVLGLGWAATPSGLRAMEELSTAEIRSKGVATDAMCTFLILNISSLQIIPINIIAYRSQYGSVNPTAVTGPAIVATSISTLTAVIYCKLRQKKGN